LKNSKIQNLGEGLDPEQELTCSIFICKSQAKRRSFTNL